MPELHKRLLASGFLSSGTNSKYLTPHFYYILSGPGGCGRAVRGGVRVQRQDARGPDGLHEGEPRGVAGRAAQHRARRAAQEEVRGDWHPHPGGGHQARRGHLQEREVRGDGDGPPGLPKVDCRHQVDRDQRSVTRNVNSELIYAYL